MKGVSGLNVSPLMLLVRDPSVKSIRDFKDNHRIALPAVSGCGASLRMPWGTICMPLEVRSGASSRLMMRIS